MSSSEDDWEKDCDSDKEEQKQKEAEQAKKKAFDGEDEVDAEEKKKQLAKEVAEKRAKEIEENKRTKKSNKVDYEAQFEKRQAALAGIKPTTAEEQKDQTGMSKGAKGMVLEMAAEKGLTDQLFGGMDEPVPVNLNSEKDYKNFGTNTAKLLYAGSAPYRIENFFRELSRDLPEHCDSKQIQKIIDHLTIKQKDLAKKEKEARDGKNKKTAKASLKGGGGKNYEMNNNTAMINDVMGDFGDDYGNEGEGEGFKREEEGDYDFM